MLRAIFFTILLPGTAMAQTGLATEVYGSRSLAMGGAHRGLGDSNDTIFMNPAGMSRMKRYSIDASYSYSPFDTISHLNVSALDSKSGPLAGALGYIFSGGDGDRRDAELHRFFLASSYQVLDWFALGLNTRYITGRYSTLQDDKTYKQKDLSFVFNMDFGVMFMLPAGVSLGLSYTNVITTDAKDIEPPVIGTGLSWQAKGFSVAADVNVNVSDFEAPELSYHLGAEYVIAKVLPVRLGYRYGEEIDGSGQRFIDNFISGGVSYAGKTIGVDAAFDVSANRPDLWRFVGGLKIFLGQK